MERTQYIPNSWEYMGKIYYVAQKNADASDDNPGTPERPFRTISGAASVMRWGETVVIDEGVYREEVPVLRNGHMYQPRSLPTFKAAPGKQVFLKGADVFDPRWKTLADDLYEAALPEELFAEGAYNPYALSLAVDAPGRVRPAPGTELIETLGQVYIDGKPLPQARSLDEVRATPRSFLVSADGKRVIVHVEPGVQPQDALMELTVRQRCFKPVFGGVLYIRTLGMVVEGAAEPGAFSLCRPFSLRREAGVSVRKSICMRGTTMCHCALLGGGVGYRSTESNELVGTAVDDTRPYPPEEVPVLDVTSVDGGRTWQVSGEAAGRAARPSYGYFLDEEHNVLCRYYGKVVDGSASDMGSEESGHLIMFEISRDGGRSWSDPVEVGRNGYYYRIRKLQDGSLFWPYTEGRAGLVHQDMKCLLGRWDKSLGTVHWRRGGGAEVSPRKSMGGLDEPASCQFPDGRIFVALRQGAMLVSQDDPGAASVKLYTVSEDGGETWSEPEPLTYEDGRWVYSPRSYQDAILSSKNGKPYVILNIASGPCFNCDPRTSLHIAEVDTDTLCLKRDSIAVIDTKHEEHHELVRFSNWQTIEDRKTRNLLLFMKLHMSQYCPVRDGYDCNLYRYEIELP